MGDSLVSSRAPNLSLGPAWRNVVRIGPAPCGGVKWRTGQMAGQTSLTAPVLHIMATYSP